MTATAGTGVISLSGASVTKMLSCTLSVNVTGTAEGDALNTTGRSVQPKAARVPLAIPPPLKVVAPPSIRRRLAGDDFVERTTSATFTITNPAS